MAVPSFPSSGKCFLYCNGLMDHLYVCQNGNGCTAWYKAPGHFTGTLVGAPGWARSPSHRGVFWGIVCPSPTCNFRPGCSLCPQDAFVKITRYEGIRSLWSGLPPTL